MSVNEGFLSSLGLARRAGKLVIGWDRIKDCGENIFLLIVSSDASAKTSANAKKMSDKILKVPENMDDIGRALGVGRAAFVAVTDKGFAGLLLKKASAAVADK